jgi:charged multivesicular body protein 3
VFASRPPPPEEQAKAWKKTIRTETRKIESQIRRIQTEEDRVKQRIKTLCRQGNNDASMPLVRTIVQSRRARSQLLKTTTQLGSLVRTIDLQLAELKVTGCFKQSAEITHMLNNMVKLPDVQAMVSTLGQEMMHAGIAQEMIADGLDTIGAGGDPEDEELATRLVYNEIAKEVNRTARTPVALLPVDPSELEADPRAVAISSG